MENIKKFEGSVSAENLMVGMLLISDDNTFGGVWEKCVGCNNCAFAKQCAQITKTLEDNDKNPSCADVINILTGELKAEDVK